MKRKITERTESLTKQEMGPLAHLLWVSWEVRPPGSEVLKRSKELHLKMQQIHEHNVCFGEGTAGITKTVQEGRLGLIAENSTFSTEY